MNGAISKGNNKKVSSVFEMLFLFSLDLLSLAVVVSCRKKHTSHGNILKKFSWSSSFSEEDAGGFAETHRRYAELLLPDVTVSLRTPSPPPEVTSAFFGE